MAEYRVSKVQMLPGSDGYVADRLGGAGWSDEAVNIIAYIRRRQHSFVMATAQGNARFVVMRDAAGADCLVAVDGDGQLVPLSSLQNAVSNPVAAPTQPLLRQLARLLGAGARA